jgi:decaprenylphospho-beta-D-erythro-pentofuranosid-2-ulose 2-reductase
MNILVIGATSAIAKATARYYVAKGGASLFLVGRNRQALQDLQSDLVARGAAKVAIAVHDLNDRAAYPVWIDEGFSFLQTVDIALMAHSILGTQADCEKDVAAMREVMETNGLGSIEILTHLANHFERQKNGTIAYISSVAGDRGRASNYVYGASKALVTAFLQGLRVRLARCGVNVLTIKPGFVDTPMTAGFEKKGLLWAQPEQIAKGIAAAISSGKGTVYLPWFWRIIMGIIIHIPDTIFKKLSL